MFYMVNPSDLPNKKNKKSRRRNPELLIVNPYSLDEEKKMAKKKSKKKARKNPSRRRRNPEAMIQDVVQRVAETPSETMNLLKSDGVNMAIAAVGGAVVLTIVRAKLAPRLTGITGVGLGTVLALAGAGLGVLTGNLMGNDDLGKALAGAALTLGVAQMAEPVIATLGLGEWQAEHLSGYSPYGQQYLTEDGALAGFGQPVHPPLTDTLGSYEAMGDIYNSQRLGAFEAEHGVAGLSGFGAHVPEVARPDRDQQPAETKAWDKSQSLPGFYAGYEMGEHMYDDLFGPNS